MPIEDVPNETASSFFDSTGLLNTEDMDLGKTIELEREFDELSATK